MSTHVIGRQVLDLRIEAGGNAFALQQEVGEAYRRHVLPALAALFDRYAGPDLVVRIDRLEVDVGRLAPEALDEQFAARVCEALEPVLARHVRSAGRPDVDGVERRDADAHVLALWHHLLRRGYLPWWAPPAAAEALQPRLLALLSTGALPAATRRLLRDEPVARRRCVLQASDALFAQLLQGLDGPFAERLLPLQDALQGLARAAGFRTARTEALRHALREAALQEALRPAGTGSTQRVQAVVGAAIGIVAGRRPASWIRPLRAALAPGLASLQARLDDDVRRRLDRLLQALDDDASAPPGAPVATKPSAPADAAPPGSTAGAATGPGREAPVAPAAPAARDADTEAGTPGAGGAQRQAVDPGADAGPPPSNGAGLTARREGGRKGMHPDRPGTEAGASPPGRTSAVREGEAIYVDDAGLVLLHPYIERHFSRLGWVEAGRFVDEQAQERAAHQLRYLAAGEQAAPEYALLLPRLLCGIPLETPLPRHVLLGDEALAEADALLTAVIRHWGALKNTSPAGLREAFLRREGRLLRTDGGWRLAVASRTIDILLHRLPWGLSVIRLPWMSELLYVDWG